MTNDKRVDDFICKSTNSAVKVILNNDSIEVHHFKAALNDRIIQFKDITGIFIEFAFSPLDTAAYLTINANPRILNNEPNGPNGIKKAFKRSKICIELAFNKFKTDQENYNHLLKWQKKANQKLGIKSPRKRFLIFINPKSGPGKSVDIYLKHAFPMFLESHVHNNVVLTENPNFAKEYVKTNDLSEYKGIIVVSGDGLVFEVINGLLERPDWNKAIKIPIGQIPGGSANGLACSIAYLANEDYKDSIKQFSNSLAFHYSKSESKPIDLIRIQLQNGRILHSFLNIEFGMPADIDLESERFRIMGSQRFLVGLLNRLISKVAFFV